MLVVKVVLDKLRITISFNHRITYQSMIIANSAMALEMKIFQVNDFNLIYLIKTLTYILLLHNIKFNPIFLFFFFFSFFFFNLWGKFTKLWNFGPPSYEYEYGCAIVQYEEKTIKSKKHVSPKFSLCFTDGQVNSPLLKYCIVLTLTKNMMLEQNPGDNAIREFAQ